MADNWPRLPFPILNPMDLSFGLFPPGPPIRRRRKIKPQHPTDKRAKVKAARKARQRTERSKSNG